MYSLDLRISGLAREFLCSLHGLLGFDRQFVESKCHDSSRLSAVGFRPDESASWPIADRREPTDSSYFFTSNSASTTSSSPVPVDAPSVAPGCGPPASGPAPAPAVDLYKASLIACDAASSSLMAP